MLGRRVRLVRARSDGDGDARSRMNLDVLLYESPASARGLA